MTLYEQERSRIKTGDILLFSGRGATSDLIKIGTGSQWSHVGMALKVDDWDLLLSMESTTLSNVEDIDAGKGLQGVQTVALSSRVRHYRGAVAVRHLLKPLCPNEVAALAAFRREMRGRPYEKHKLVMVKAALGLPRDYEDLSSVFCSETVAAAMQRIGLFPRMPDADSFVPRDLSGDPRAGFEFVNRLYGPEVSIKDM